MLAIFPDVTVAVAAVLSLVNVAVIVPSAVTSSEKTTVKSTVWDNFFVAVVGFSDVVISNIVGRVIS